MTGLPVRRRCRHSGIPFLAIRHDQVFCKQQCRRAWHSWRETRGAQAIELLIRWRRDRRRGGLSDLAAFADGLVRQYRKREADRQKGAQEAAEAPQIDPGGPISAETLERATKRPALAGGPPR